MCIDKLPICKSDILTYLCFIMIATIEMLPFIIFMITSNPTSTETASISDITNLTTHNSTWSYKLVNNKSYKTSLAKSRKQRGILGLVIPAVSSFFSQLILPILGNLIAENKDKLIDNFVPKVKKHKNS